MVPRGLKGGGKSDDRTNRSRWVAILTERSAMDDASIAAVMVVEIVYFYGCDDNCVII